MSPSIFARWGRLFTPEGWWLASVTEIALYPDGTGEVTIDAQSDQFIKTVVVGFEGYVEFVREDPSDPASWAGDGRSLYDPVYERADVTVTALSSSEYGTVDIKIGFTQREESK